MGTKILSVIIPVYNAEKYIANILKNLKNKKMRKLKLYWLMMDQEINLWKYVRCMQIGIRK